MTQKHQESNKHTYIKSTFQKPGKASLLTLAILLLAVGLDFGRLDHYYSYGGDGQYKLIQAWSFLAADFQSEEIYYQNRGIDPGFELYPIGYPYRLQNRGRQIGQYPLFLTAINAPALHVFGVKHFTIFFMATAMLLFAFMGLAFRLRPAGLLLAALGTPLMLYGYEVSEHPLLLLLQMGGLVLLFQRQAYLQFLSGILLGIGVFLRLEVLIFTVILSLVLLCFDVRQSLFAFWKHFQKFFEPHPWKSAWKYPWKNFWGYIWKNFSRNIYKQIKKHFKTRFLFYLALLLSFSGFFVFNYWNYGHPLGPRYLINVEGAPWSVLQQLRIASVLLFAGYYKVGLFGFTPVFLLVFVFFLSKKRRALLGTNEQIFFWTSLLFVATVALISPNDGAINWGSRYLNLAFLPLIVLADRFFASLKATKNGQVAWKVATYSCFAISIAMFYFGLKIQHSAYKQLEIYQKDFRATGSKNIVSQNTILIYHAGAMLLSHNFMNPRSEKAVEILVRESKKGHWKDLVYIEPLPPKNMKGLAGEVFQKTLLDSRQQEIRKAILKSFRTTSQKDLKHIRVFYLAAK